MRKLGLLIVALFIALPIALVATSARAGTIDSSTSGTYLGADRVCRVVLSQYSSPIGGVPRPWWVQVDLRCLTFAGVSTYSLTTVWSPNACPQGGAYWLNPWPQGVAPEFLSLRSYDASKQTLDVILGSDRNAVYDGRLETQRWFRIGPVASPAPYSCGAGR